jgi:hypothetical protein
MMVVMVKEADLNQIEVPENYEVLDATALGRRLGFKRETVLAYLSRRNFRRMPRPSRLLWDLSGTRRALESGRRRRRVGCVASRRGDGERTIAPRNNAILNSPVETRVPIVVETG